VERGLAGAEAEVQTDGKWLLSSLEKNVPERLLMIHGKRIWDGKLQCREE
jgi:hypothetical protein